MALRLVSLLTAMLAAFALMSGGSGSAAVELPPGAAPGVDRADPVTLTAATRPAATPSLLRVASPAEPMPFAVVADTVPPTALARFEPREHTTISAPYTARRPAEGDRAPPSGSRTA